MQEEKAIYFGALADGSSVQINTQKKDYQVGSNGKLVSNRKEVFIFTHNIRFLRL